MPALLFGTNSFFYARFVPQEQAALLLMLLGAVTVGFGATIAAVRRVEAAQIAARATSVRTEPQSSAP